MINIETRRLLLVGRMLLIGPKKIFPAGEDRHSFLESTVLVQWRSGTAGMWRSMQVYCDANGSDDIGYLAPMVRFASWHREKDVFVTRPPWPDVSVELAMLPADSSDLQAGIRRLQEMVRQVPFVPHGLPTRRNFGECPGSDEGHLTVEIGSGWQTMTRSLEVAEAPPLREFTVTLENDLRRLALPVDRGVWLEWYDQSPVELLQSDGWYWDGQPVPC